MSDTPDAATLAEQSVLGALLLDSSARSRCNGLAREHFSSDQHRVIFAAICDALEDCGASDSVTVFERLQSSGKAEDAGGLAYLNNLAGNTPSAANVTAYAELVEKHARRRQRLAALEEARAAVERGDEEAALKSLARAAKLSEPEQKRPADLPRVLSIAELSRTEPEAPEFVVADWLPCGETSLLAGHGGSGKSAIALYLAVCVALGKPFFGIPTQRRRVLFISLEDGEAVLHWRLRRIAEWLGVSLDSLREWLVLADGSHAEAELYTETKHGAALTHVYEWTAKQMEGREVLVLDGISDAYGADEIRRRHVRAFVRAIRRLVPATGAALLLGHIDKASAKLGDTSQGYSGSTAWNNSVRSRWYLRPEVESGELLLELQKSNYSPAGAQVRVRWLDQAHVFAGELVMPAGRLDRLTAESDEREAIVRLVRQADQAGEAIPAAASGWRTSWHALKVRSGFPPALASGSGKARFWRLLEELRAAGAVRVESVQKKNRHHVEVLRAG